MRFPLIAAVLLFLGALLLVLHEDGQDRDAPRYRPEPASPAQDPAALNDEVPPVERGSPGADGATEETREVVRRTDPAGVVKGELFKGSVRLAGAVVDRARASIEDARVIVRPLGFYPHREEHFSALATRTGGDGRFVLDAAPMATHYEMYAVTATGAVGKVYVPRSDAMNGSVSVIVARVVYERYLVFDSDGEPIPVREHGIGGALGGENLRDSIRPPEPLFDEILEELGWRPSRRVTNEMFSIYSDALARSDTLSLQVPGYHRQNVRVVRRPLVDWPAATRVRLERNAGDERVRYRIAFPEFGGSDSDPILPELYLEVRVEGVGTTNVVGRRCPCVWAPKGSTFEIKQTGFEPLSYSTKKDGNGVLLEPDYPTFGYLELEREVRESENEGGRSPVFTLDGFFPSLRGLTINEQQAVIGPLPVGTYTVLASSYRDGKTVLTKIGPVSVGGGRNAFSWR